MAQPTPHVERDVLTLESSAGASTIAVDSPAWFSWLEQASAFSFTSPQGSFTARRERASNGRGDWYWRAYRYRGGARRRAYLGRAAELSLERLQMVAAQLAGPETPTPPSAPGPPATAAPAPGLLTTKLYRPQSRPDLVARPRLLDRLDAGLHGPLTLVCAPAGFGKTTLLADWLGRTECPVAWLGLDASDSDLVVFLRYLVAALQTLAPQVGAALADLLESPQPPAVEALLTTLLNDMTALPSGSLLVLDDYHVITTPAIHHAVSFLIDHLPPTLHLVIATREDPPIPLARLRARRQVSELRAEQLRFTAEEAAAFLTEVMALTLTANDLAALGARTEGWIAGLQLAALAMQDRDEYASFIAAFTGSNRFIVDYLADEVLSRQPAHIQSFLVQTAILDRMSGPLCDSVRGEEAPIASTERASQHLLEQLERANLFVVPLDAERQWYRYHHLFSEMLRARLRRDMPISHVAALHRRAGAWYAHAGYTSEAVQHALVGQDYAQAALLVERVALAMIQRSELARLLVWIERLPQEAVQARPLLGLSYAWGLFLSGRIGAAVARLDMVEAALAASGTPPPPEAQGHIAAMRAYLVRETGDLDATIAYSRQAIAHLARHDTLLRAMVVVNLAIAQYLKGAFDQAAELLSETVASGRTAQLMANTLSAIYIHTQLLRYRGDLGQALQVCQEGLALVERHGWQRSPAVGFLHVAIGELLRERNQLDAAAEHLARGITLGREGGHPHILIAGNVWLAWLRQTQADAAGSQEAIDAALQVVQTYQVSRYWPLPVAAACQARLWIVRGDLAGASLWGQAREGSWGGISGDYIDEAEDVTLARLWIAQGAYVAATDLLSHLQRAATAGGRRGSLIEILILQAIANAARQREQDALEALSQALGLAAPEGYVRIFVDEGAPMRQLLEAQSAERRAQSDPLQFYRELLLSAFQRSDEAQTGGAQVVLPSALERSNPLAEPLSARELEVLELIAAGHSNQAIADTLIIAVGTVKKHINNIYSKLDVQSRTQALARARELSLL